MWGHLSVINKTVFDLKEAATRRGFYFKEAATKRRGGKLIRKRMPPNT